MLRFLKKTDFSFLATLLVAAAAIGFQYAEGPSPVNLSPAGATLKAEYEPLEAPEPSFLIKFKPRLVPFDAAKIALADALRFPMDAKFFRYIFLPEKPEIQGPMVNLAVNLALSHSTLIQFGYEVHPQVIRYDLRLLAPQAADLKNLVDTFEEFAFDPYFHEFLIIADELDDALDKAIDTFRIFLAELDSKDDTDNVRATRQFLIIAQLQSELSRNRTPNTVILDQFVKAADRYLYEKKITNFTQALQHLRDAVANLSQQAKDRAKIEVQGRRSGQGALAGNQEVVVPARHAGLALAALFDVVQSDAAIVRADHFIYRALSSIDQGSGAGLYYQFTNIRTNLNDGKTDFQRLLADLGVDLEVTGNLRSKASAAFFHSNVTGRERKVVLVGGQGVAPTRGTGLVVYTQDPSQEQTAAANSPIDNVVDFEFAAQELIGTRPNGTLVFALFNAAGLLQNSAPDNVVIDRTVPPPHPVRLHSGMSCMRCHGPQSCRMSVANNVRDMAYKGLDLLDDLSSGDGKEDFFDRITGEYESNPMADILNQPLQRSRDDFQNAVVVATSGVLVTDPLLFPGSRLQLRLYSRKEGRGFTTIDALATLSTIYNYYTYDAVTPLIALRDLGYDAPDEKSAVDLIRLVLSPTLPNEYGVTQLDAHIEALRFGNFAMPRPSWELVYFDGALRSILTAKLIKERSITPQTKLPINNNRPLKKRPAKSQRLTLDEQLRKYSKQPVKQQPKKQMTKTMAL